MQNKCRLQTQVYGLVAGQEVTVMAASGQQCNHLNNAKVQQHRPIASTFLLGSTCDIIPSIRTSVPLTGYLHMWFVGQGWNLNVGRPLSKNKACESLVICLNGIEWTVFVKPVGKIRVNEISLQLLDRHLESWLTGLLKQLTSWCNPQFSLHFTDIFVNSNAKLLYLASENGVFKLAEVTVAEWTLAVCWFYSRNLLEDHWSL